MTCTTTTFCIECAQKRFYTPIADGRGLFQGFALAAIVTVSVIVTMPHGPILVALPITMAFSFSAGLLPSPLISAPLISAPVVSAPIVSTIMPMAVMPVSVVMGKHQSWLLVGHTAHGQPKVVGGLDRSLNGWDFSCENRG